MPGIRKLIEAILCHKDTHKIAGILLLVLTTITVFQPPAAVDINKGEKNFSAWRALKHLQIIAAKPHPVGSIAHREAHKYIQRKLVSYGLEVESEPVSSGIRFASVVRGADVQNIIGKIPGNGENRETVIAMAHYDSAPQSYGANDDGAGVAALLETARILAAEAQKKKFDHDIYFLFTDAEEMGLLGAVALQDDWRVKNAKIILNFEARGNRGPAMMFQSSDNNYQLIKSLAANVSRPVASSLVGSLVKILPNDTDLTIFLQRGIPAMNFAYAEGALHYHTPLDHVAYTNPDSLQHHGDYAVNLLRHFAGSQTETDASFNAIYFNLLPGQLIYYPEFAAYLLILLNLFFWYKYVRRIFSRTPERRRHLLHDTGKFSFLFVFVIALGICYHFAANYLLGRDLMMAHDKRLFLGLLFLILAVYFRFLKAFVHEFATGASFTLLTILMVPFSFFLPGVSYLFHLPLLLGLPFFTFLHSNRNGPVLRNILMVTYVLPVTILCVHTVHQMQIFDSGNFIVIPAVFVFLSLTIYTPIFSHFTMSTKRLLSFVSLGLGLLISFYSFIDNQYGEDAPFFSTMNYLEVHQKKSAASYFTMNQKEARLIGDIDYKMMSEVDGYEFTAPVAVHKPADMSPHLVPPFVRVLSKKSLPEGKHIYKLKISTFNKHYCFYAEFDDDVSVNNIKVNDVEVAEFTRFGKKIDDFVFRHFFGFTNLDGFEMKYCGQSVESEGVTLELITDSATTPTLKVTSFRYDFDARLRVPERPDFVLASPFSERSFAHIAVEL